MTGQSVTRIRVGASAAAEAYEVLVGRRILEDPAELHRLIGPHARRVALIHPEALTAVAGRLRAQAEELGCETITLRVPDGEAAKTADVAAHCWQRLGRSGFTRTDVIVGVGGGATTDLAGFVAASWLRGVRWIAVPTTVLAMVDAAVGGKTGINTAEGKNLVGAFHPPAGVLCDLAALDSLPVEDHVSGLAEIIKAGFISDPVILDLIEADPAGARSPRGPQLPELIRRSIQVKADVVSSDLKESGLREILNYGHTLAHAIERSERYTWRHGEAVSVGMVFAAELAALDGRLPVEEVARHRAVLTSVGLPVTCRGDRWPALLDTMRVDKKTRGARLRFIVLDAVGRPAVLADPAPELLEAAYARIAAPAPEPEPGGRSGEPRRVLVLSGPNLGRLGSREPGIYGTTSYAELAETCRSLGKELGLDVDVRRSDDEAELIHWLHEAADLALPVVLNPAAFTHYSYALRDAVAQRTAPLIEVHLSNPHAREPFRHRSVISPVASGTIAGLGTDSYLLALRSLAGPDPRAGAEPAAAPGAGADR
ncbi:3-dehydroquinate synthase/3-dehydroquinate dehydratase type II [Streptomyces sp. TE12347]